MNNQSDQQRIKIIYQMLFEMAISNLAFRIPLEDSNDPLNELEVLLNCVAEKMQLVISQSGYINPNYQSSAKSPQSDAVLLQNVYEYILNHLEEPLPSTKELSKMFGTNEFKLKDSFRHFFNTSIYQLYTKERLKNAHQLIQKTTITLKEIAFISGFNDYVNFSKAFKKRYGYSPSELKREYNDS